MTVRSHRSDPPLTRQRIPFLSHPCGTTSSAGSFFPEQKSSVFAAREYRNHRRGSRIVVYKYQTETRPSSQRSTMSYPHADDPPVHQDGAVAVRDVICPVGLRPDHWSGLGGGSGGSRVHGGFVHGVTMGDPGVCTDEFFAVTMGPPCVAVGARHHSDHGRKLFMMFLMSSLSHNAVVLKFGAWGH